MSGTVKVYAVKDFDIEDFKKSKYFKKFEEERAYTNDKDYVKNSLEEIKFNSVQDGCAYPLTEYLDEKGAILLNVTHLGGAWCYVVTMIPYKKLKEIVNQLET